MDFVSVTPWITTMGASHARRSMRSRLPVHLTPPSRVVCSVIDGIVADVLGAGSARARDLIELTDNAGEGYVVVVDAALR
jgi:hypothetical protein